MFQKYVHVMSYFWLFILLSIGEINTAIAEQTISEMITVQNRWAV